MGLFRRDPLHRRLARAGGLLIGPQPPDDMLSRLAGAGIHGLHRMREWDAVVTADAPPLEGERAVFVALPDGSLIVEEGEGDLAVLADAVETRLERPYRAEAVRRHETLWAVAARALAIVAARVLVGAGALERSAVDAAEPDLGLEVLGGGAVVGRIRATV